MSTWEKLLGFFWPEGLWPPLRHPVGSDHAICLHSVSLLNQEKENVPQNQAASLCEVLWHSWAKIVAVGVWANPLIATRWVCECNWNLIVPSESRCHTTNTICPSICSSETEAQPANWTHKCKAYFHQLCLVFSYKPQHLSDTPTCKQLPYTHTQSHSERGKKSECRMRHRERWYHKSQGQSRRCHIQAVDEQAVNNNNKKRWWKSFPEGSPVVHHQTEYLSRLLLYDKMLHVDEML